MSVPRRLAILGSTGSIGRSTLDVVSRHPERFRVETLAANSNTGLLLRQIERFRPRLVAVADPEAAARVARRLRRFGNAVRLAVGPEGVRQAAVAPRVQMVVAAIVGTPGLLPTLAAIHAGKDIALANKEVLVMAGDRVMAAVRRHGVRLLPIDSEHAALAQCLRGHAAGDVRRLLLTASGGPFRTLSAEKLRHVTARDALRHPTWSMGPKITIDSSTLMNKGLEIIEAHHLFGIPYDRIDVVVHPESIVHSLVEFVDGSVLAQLSSPDMRLPIQTALTEPERLGRIIRPLDFARGLQLRFAAPDRKRFPALDLAVRAGRTGGTAPAVLNAANEVAVRAFLEGRTTFIGISRVIDRVLRRCRRFRPAGLQDILQADAWARQTAEEELACRQ